MLKYTPRILIIDQTARCNEACYFCWRADVDLVKQQMDKAPRTEDGKRQLDLPIEMLEEILIKAKAHPFQTLNYCGPMGDMSVMKDAIQRGNLGAKYGYQHRMLNTNAVALDQHDPEEFLRAFTDIKMSIDTINPTTYKLIHGRSHHDRVIQNAETYARVKKEKNIPGRFSAKITVNKDNQQELGELKAFFRRLGIPVVEKKIHSFIDTLPEHGQDIGMKLCDQPYKVMNFNFRGEMTTCCINYKLEPTFGHISEGSLKDLWEGEKFENWRKTRLEGLCKGCTGLGYRNRDSKQLARYESMGEERYNL